MVTLYFLCGIIIGFIAAYGWLRKSNKERRSFLTGSLAYGHEYRHSGSDVDILVFLSTEDLETLWPYVKSKRDKFKPFINDQKKLKGRIKTGEFDLILCTEKKEWDHWKRVTEKLKRTSGLTKSKVISTFEEDRKKML